MRVLIALLMLAFMTDFSLTASFKIKGLVVVAIDGPLTTSSLILSALSADVEGNSVSSL